MGEPGAGAVEKCGGFDFGIDAGLRPGVVRYMKETAEGAVFGEGDVALEEEMVECSWHCTLKCWTCIEGCAVSQSWRHGHRRTAAHATQNLTRNIFSLMRVIQFSESIRQTVEDRAQHRGEAVVEPFGQEIDAAKLANANVGADVEEGVGVQGLGHKFEMRMMEPYVAECEGDEGDVGIAFVQVQLEGDLRLEKMRGDAEVEEEGAVPGAVKKRVLERSMMILKAAELSFGHMALLHSTAKSAQGLWSIHRLMFQQFC